MSLDTFRVIRRLVTANDSEGLSYFLLDGPSPKIHQRETGPVRGHTDLWVWNETPLPLGGLEDASEFPYDFPRGRKMAVIYVLFSQDLSQIRMISQKISRSFRNIQLKSWRMVGDGIVAEVVRLSGRCTKLRRLITPY